MEPTRGKKLTKETVNERLLNDGRGIQLVGEYVNANTKTLFQCAVGHQWIATYGHLYSGKGCPDCAGRPKITKKIVNERLMKDGRGIQIVGEYVNNHTKTLFQCDHDHQWVTTYGCIYNGHGCPICAGTGTLLTREQITQRLQSDGRGITLIGEYMGANKKNKFQCIHGHKWTTNYGNIYSGDGCPTCAGYGFTGDKPGWRYVLLFSNRERPFIKFGITNRLEQRLAKHRRNNGAFEIAWTHHDIIGHETSKWEYKIKKMYGGRYVTKDECPDGFTETLPPSRLNEIIGEQP